MQQHKHAVLNNTQLTILAHNRQVEKVELIGIPGDAAALFEVCQRLYITHIWILPNSLIDQAGYTFYENIRAYRVWYPRSEDGTPLFEWPKTVSIRDRQRVVLVSYPVEWGWKATTALDILATIFYLEEVLGVVRVEWSEGHIALSLLKELNSAKENSSWLKTGTPANVPFTKAARDILWKKPGGVSQEMLGLWIHHYDKFSSYISACQGVSVGTGEALHIEGEGTTSQAGIYHVAKLSYEQGTLFDGERLPRLFSGEWLTLDMLKFARMQGYNIEIDQAYVFAEKHALFKRWSAKLWDGRAALRASSARFPHDLARENAYTTIKTIALVGVGKLAYKEQQTVHANWWGDIVSKSVVALGHNLTKFAISKIFPFLIYSDGLYFASHEKDAALAVPNILARDGELGGYKHVYSVQITQEIIDASQSLTPGELVTFLRERSSNV